MAFMCALTGFMWWYELFATRRQIGKLKTVPKDELHQIVVQAYHANGNSLAYEFPHIAGHIVDGNYREVEGIHGIDNVIELKRRELREQEWQGRDESRESG